MKASIDVLSFADTRKVAILGDMFELGSNEKEMHKEVGVHAAEKGIDLVICIGSLSKNIADGVHFAAKNCSDSCDTDTCCNTAVYHFDTKEDFFAQSKELLKENDTILVKASHGMEFPEIIEKLQK